MVKTKKHSKVYAKKKRKLSVFFKLSFGLLFLFIFLGISIFIYYAKDLPRPDSFLEKKVFQAAKIYDRTGEVLLYTAHGEEKREIISLEEMSDYVKQAVIAAEDENFYQHRGVDIKGILRSTLANLELKRLAQGGSTITQQLIRSSFLTREKTLERKIKEIALSLELERKYSKEEILEWYLNQVPFGSNTYGVQAASQTFFKKDCKDLTLAEAAILASLVQAPSLLSPYGENQNLLSARKDHVLTKMASLGFVGEEEAQEAKEETIEFEKITSPIKAPHFSLYVRDYLVKKYGNEFLSQKGLKIYTSLDWDLQKEAEEIVRRGVEANKTYNSHNASLVAIDPNSGEILAMVGSADWFADSYPEGCISGKNCSFEPQFNIAIGTINNPGRQPGSAFKPFAYVTAFNKGFTSETVLWDVKTEFNLYCSPNADQTKDKYGLDCYSPGNYDGRFRGIITMRNSLAQSINVTSVKTLYLAGIEETISLAKEMGITTLKDSSYYGLALVLGGGEVKLLDMVSAYGVFATEGLTIPPVSIVKIEDLEGNIIEENRKTSKRILEAEPCRVLNDVLSDNEARTPVFGSRSTLHFENYQVAVKTGTTQGYRDAWTVGYTPSIVVGVWAGNNDNSPTAQKPGLVLAAPIWHEFMNIALAKFPKKDFNEPKEIDTDKPVLNGMMPASHSILYYLDKNDPLGEHSVSQDAYFNHWEIGVQNWLK
jgi:penicillin-binding protein 1C